MTAAVFALAAWFAAGAAARAAVVPLDPAHAPISLRPATTNATNARLTVVDSSSPQPWAILVPTGVGRVDVFEEHHPSVHLLGGFDTAWQDEAIGARVLPLPPGSGARTFVVRVAQPHEVERLALVPLASALHDVLVRNALHVFFIGYFGAMAALYFAFFTILRTRVLGLYVLTLVSFIALLAIDAGAPWHFIVSTQYAREIVHDAIFYAYFISLCGFATTFLGLRRGDRLALAFVIAACVANAAGVVADVIPIPEPVVDGVTLTFFAVLAGAAVRAARRDVTAASLFATAMGVVLAGYGINAAISYDWIRNAPYLALWGFEFAIALESLILGVALAQRMRETTHEYDRLVHASRELEGLAKTDGLTGVPNRRALSEFLHSAWRQAARHNATVGALLIDIDHFKRYNDAFGHLRGDECLRRIAQACAQRMRDGELFARYGGEEFAAILPGASPDDVDAVAARIIDAVRALDIPSQSDGGDGGGARVTVSIGAAIKRAQDGEVESDLLSAADTALYRAKRFGRDRVEISD